MASSHFFPGGVADVSLFITFMNLSECIIIIMFTTGNSLILVNFFLEENKRSD